MQPDEWDAKAREMARAILLDTQAIQVEGTSDNASGYGPPYKAPWYIMDTSKAEPEVNWPGELIEIVTDPGMISKRLMAAREKIALLVICEAYQRGRNEADTAAERRGIEQAIQQIGAIASGYESDTVDSFVEQVRALAQPAGASDREGRSALDDAEDERSQGDSDEQSSHGQFRPSAPGGFHGSDVPHLRSHR